MPWTDLTIETERLRLRPFAEADRPVLIQLLTDPHVRRYLGGPADLPADFASYPLGQQAGVWCVERVVDATAIGSVSIHDEHHGRPELSFSFVSAAWGSGFATEACSAALDWFWDHDPTSDDVVAITQVANTASQRLLARLDFEEIAQREEYGEQQSIQLLRRSG